MKPDRRVHRTRQLLHDALLDLIMERGYAVVSIQDILDRAGIARSTFYAHFRDKDDLLLTGFQAMRDAMPGNLFASPARAEARYPAFGLMLFRHVEENRALARAFVGTDAGQVVMNNLRHLLVADTRHWVQQHAALREGVEREWVVQYLVGALFGLLTWWVDHDFPCGADDMAGMYQDMAERGLNGVGGTAQPLSAPSAAA